MVSEELPTENALNGFRGVTNGGYPFWLQRNFRQRVSFLVAEKLQMEDALSGFRGYPFRFQRSYRQRMPGLYINIFFNLYLRTTN